MIDGADCSSLVMHRISREHTQARAIIDRGVLVVVLLRPGLPEGLNELHINLQGVA